MFRVWGFGLVGGFRLQGFRVRWSLGLKGCLGFLRSGFLRLRRGLRDILRVLIRSRWVLYYRRDVQHWFIKKADDRATIAASWGLGPGQPPVTAHLQLLRARPIKPVNSAINITTSMGYMCLNITCQQGSQLADLTRSYEDIGGKCHGWVYARGAKLRLLKERSGMGSSHWEVRLAKFEEREEEELAIGEDLLFRRRKPTDCRVCASCLQGWFGAERPATTLAASPNAPRIPPCGACGKDRDRFDCHRRRRGLVRRRTHRRESGARATVTPQTSLTCRQSY